MQRSRTSIGLENYEYNLKILKEYMTIHCLDPVDVSRLCNTWSNTILNIIDGYTYGCRDSWIKIGRALGLRFKLDVEKKVVEKPKKIIKDIDGVPIYVFNNLRMHGNTLINRKKMKKYGKERLLQVLLKEGYEVTLKNDADGDFILNVK